MRIESRRKEEWLRVYRKCSSLIIFLHGKKSVSVCVCERASIKKKAGKGKEKRKRQGKNLKHHTHAHALFFCFLFFYFWWVYCVFSCYFLLVFIYILGTDLFPPFPILPVLVFPCLHPPLLHSHSSCLCFFFLLFLIICR